MPSKADFEPSKSRLCAKQSRLLLNAYPAGCLQKAKKGRAFPPSEQVAYSSRAASMVAAPAFLSIAVTLTIVLHGKDNNIY